MILGIDPSLTGTGVVALEDGKIINQQLIKTKPTKGSLAELQRLIKIVDSIEYGEAELAVIEGLAFMSRNTTSLVQLSGLNYMIRHKLYKLNIPFLIVPPTSLKKFITSKGNAPKECMLMDIFKRYGEEFRDNNLADAFSLAVLGDAVINPSDKTKVYQQEVLDKLETNVIKENKLER